MQEKFIVELILLKLSILLKLILLKNQLAK